MLNDNERIFRGSSLRLEKSLEVIWRRAFGRVRGLFEPVNAQKREADWLAKAGKMSQPDLEVS